MSDKDMDKSPIKEVVFSSTQGSYQSLKYQNNEVIDESSLIDPSKKRFFSTNTNPVMKTNESLATKAISSSSKTSRKIRKNLGGNFEGETVRKTSMTTEESKSRNISRQESNKSLWTNNDFQRKNSEAGNEMLDPNIVFKSNYLVVRNFRYFLE
jgi:hypothetical protein